MSRATVEQRASAYLADVLVLFIFAYALRVVTIEPWVWVGAVAFNLLRDVTGTSPGKRLIGLTVLARADNASRAGILRRIGRNVVLAVSVAAAALVPFAGSGVVGLLLRVGPGLLVLVDAGYLVRTGERLSDRIVGTAVVRR